MQTKEGEAMVFRTRPPDFNPKFEVVSCFLEYDGKILLLHRQDYKPQGGTWGAPAGKVDAGETTLQAIIRELHEETSQVVREGDKLRYFCEVYVRFPTCDFTYHIFHLPLDHEPRISIDSGEHKAFCWVSPQDALRMNLILDEDHCIKLFYQM
ncbi:MAG: NUDIX domain-containing protein [Candidatus Taylorbacteria bacterium]|nr:NUDIX domain-containing protein [Candidatus Taylorbacteria bacterium]